MGTLLLKGSSFLVVALVALSAGRSAFALDDLVKRDVEAFVTFEAVRVESLEAAIAQRDREQAKALASRLHDEECHFLDRIAHYLRDDHKTAQAGELEGFLAEYRSLSLKDSVRVRRAAGPGHFPVVDEAVLALTGQHLAPLAMPHSAPAQTGAAGGPPVAGVGPVSSVPVSTPPRAGFALRPTPAVVADLQDPQLLVNHAAPVSLDSVRSIAAAGPAAAPAVPPPAVSRPALSGGSPAINPDADSGGAASNIRRPTGPASPVSTPVGARQATTVH